MRAIMEAVDARVRPEANPCPSRDEWERMKQLSGMSLVELIRERGPVYVGSGYGPGREMYDLAEVAEYLVTHPEVGRASDWWQADRRPSGVFRDGPLRPIYSLGEDVELAAWRYVSAVAQGVEFVKPFIQGLDWLDGRERFGYPL
jgi:hypothetical protein